MLSGLNEPMNVEAVAEPYGGQTEQFLSSAAKEFGVCLVAGAAMRGRDGRARNKALVFSPAGELLAFYAKMRPFTPGGEPDHYVAGERPVAFRWSDCTISPFICYDVRFPEIFRQAAAAHGPELFVVIANFPEKRIQHWVLLLQARAALQPDNIFPSVFPIVAAAADTGDPAAREILLQAAGELSSLVNTVAEHASLARENIMIVKTGGTVGRCAFFDMQLDTALKRALPQAQIGGLRMSPAEAAARAARS